MALAIFDLDHTLLAGDSDLAWGNFLAANNYVDSISYAQRTKTFTSNICSAKWISPNFWNSH